MAQQKMNVRVIKAEGSETSKQIYNDPFKEDYKDSTVIEPPYNLKELKAMVEYSTILGQCIDAYKVNLVGFGISPDYRFDYNAEDASNDKKNKADDEWRRIEEWKRYLNYDEEAEQVLSHVIEDRESCGNGFGEVLRDGKNKPCGLEYMDAVNIRLFPLSEPIEIEQIVLENDEPKKIKRHKRFRKYVQNVNGKKVYFKEFGDPRFLNAKTGKYFNEPKEVPESVRATEVIHFKIGTQAYGVPRWIGHLVSQYGARKAEELNYLYFKQGRHTPAAVIVENGMLTEKAYTELQEYMNGLQGSDNAHKFLLLEAEGIPVENVTDGEEKPTPVKVTIKSLAEMLQKDAMFLEYDKTSRDKLRSAFRLPPIYTGESQDYTKATADTSRKITEEQVFKPERKIIVGKLNTLFLPALDIHYVQMKLNGPVIGDPIETAKALYPFISGGAASPNDLRDLLGQILGKSLEEYEDEKYNQPFQVVLQQLKEINPTGVLKQQGNDTIVPILKDLRDLLEEMSA